MRVDPGGASLSAPSAERKEAVDYRHASALYAPLLLRRNNKKDLTTTGGEESVREYLHILLPAGWPATY